MTSVNYKSDFTLLLRLYLCKPGDEGATAEKGVEIDFPTYDWEARFWTWNKANAYTASCKGGVCTNCRNEEGKILVVFNGHGLSPGTLNVEFTALLPDDLFPDGDRRTVVPGPLGVVLTKDAACCPSTMEAEMILPYIKGDKGDAFTYDDFTDQQKADLIAPMRDDLEQFAAGKADVSQLSNILGRETDTELEEIEPNLVTDALRKTPQALTPAEQAQVKANIGIVDKQLFIDLWNAACMELNLWDYNPATVWGRYNPETDLFELNGLTDITYEQAIRIYLAGPLLFSHGSSPTMQYCSNFEIRTNLPVRYAGGAMESNYCFVRCTKLEVINGQWLNLYISTIYDCPRLRRVLSPVSMSRNIGNFGRCPKLEEIELKLTNTAPMSVSFADCPLLSLASWQYMVNNALGKAQATLAVHPDVYAKLTDAVNYPEWAAVTELAAQKNIIFAA